MLKYAATLNNEAVTLMEKGEMHQAVVLLEASLVRCRHALAVSNKAVSSGTDRRQSGVGGTRSTNDIVELTPMVVILKPHKKPIQDVWPSLQLDLPSCRTRMNTLTTKFPAL